MNEGHDKVLNFLATEWTREDGRQLVDVELLYSPGSGFRDDVIWTWKRFEAPETFATLSGIEKLVERIVEITNNVTDEHANALNALSTHRFVVRTRQFMGGRQSLSFCCSRFPSAAHVAALSDSDLDLRQQELERQSLALMAAVEVCRVEAQRRANKPAPANVAKPPDGLETQ